MESSVGQHHFSPNYGEVLQVPSERLERNDREISFMNRTEGRLAVVLGLLVCTMSLTGCITAFDTTVEPRATLEVYPEVIQEGEVVTLDARDSAAVEGVITSYTWDFGDGTGAETVVGFTSHAYSSFGQYIVRLTVTNDQGGSDDAISTVIVNGAPQINISMPDSVRAGDTALLDASATVDPEGDDLAFAWDLNSLVDSDGDGNPLNDADSMEDRVFWETSASGLFGGHLRVTDPTGAVAEQSFVINVTTRTYQVTWVTETVDFSWNEYLEQGQRWDGNMTPGENGRILSFEAILTLSQDVAPPHDNFSLGLHITEDGTRLSEETVEGNYTTNEPAKAEMSLAEMNQPGEEGLFTADSASELLQRLMNTDGESRGQGEWIWSVVAQQSDPDPLFGDIDPDPGNDWELVVEVVIMRPNLTEVATGDGN